MHDGWPYVVSAYLLAALTLGAWFAMIGLKLHRQRLLRRREAQQ